MTKRKKIILWIVGVFVAICIIAALSPGESSASGQTESNSESQETSTSIPAEAKKPKIEIISHDAKADGFAQYVYVRVKNNTNKLCDYMDITVTYFDENKKVVGTGYGNTSNFAAGTERTIECIAMNIEGSKTYEVQIGTVSFN